MVPRELIGAICLPTVSWWVGNSQQVVASFIYFIPPCQWSLSCSPQPTQTSSSSHGWLLVGTYLQASDNQLNLLLRLVQLSPSLFLSFLIFCNSHVLPLSPRLSLSPYFRYFSYIPCVPKIIILLFFIFCTFILFPTFYTYGILYFPICPIILDNPFFCLHDLLRPYKAKWDNIKLEIYSLSKTKCMYVCLSVYECHT